MSAVLKLLPEYRVAYDGCPLCGAQSTLIRTEACFEKGKIHGDLHWMKCPECLHVHTSHYFNELGTKEMLSTVMEDGFFGGELDKQRETWGRVIERMAPYVFPKQEGKWIDVGVGNGSFLFTAAEYGFNAVGIDIRPYILDILRGFGYQVEEADATTYDYHGASAVVMADILEHIPYPKDLLKRIRSKLRGPLFISCPNMDSISWKYMETVGGPPYWKEPEHYHNFTRDRLQKLLRECGFAPVHFGISTRYQAGMEIIAI